MDKITSKLRKKFNRRGIDVLGSIYAIELRDLKDDEQLKDVAGYCSFNGHKMIIRQDQDYFKGKTEEWITNDICCTIRHEIIHAFIYESGLDQCTFSYAGAWARNEEMIDWLAIQSPKIFKIFAEMDLIIHHQERLHETKSEKALSEKIKEEDKKYQKRNKKEKKKNDNK
jgi:hypothetical protein